eukprot:3688670-Rhodomonas_salina.1
MVKVARSSADPAAVVVAAHDNVRDLQEREGKGLMREWASDLDDGLRVCIDGQNHVGDVALHENSPAVRTSASPSSLSFRAGCRGGCA